MQHGGVRIAKTSVVCPISHKACIFCGLYRGRHYYQPFCQKPRRKHKHYSNRILDVDQQGVMQISKKIKVHRKSLIAGVQEEITELNFPEAKKLVDDCYKRNYLIFDNKTREVIREITQNVEEITIIPQGLAGGG